MKKPFKIISVFLIAVIGIAIAAYAFWSSLDSHTKRCLIYGKNICNFYTMMEMEVSLENYEKMIALCEDMYEVPKKDSCFEVVAQSFARIDMEKAREACEKIREISDQAGNVVHTKERCYDLIGNETQI